MTPVTRCRRPKKVQPSRPAHRQRRQRRQAKQRRRRERPRRPAPLPRAVRRVVGGLWQAFRAAFPRPTYERFTILLLAAILTAGCRTILNLLRTAETLAPGHPCSYQRAFSRRRCSLWRLGRALADAIPRRWVPTGTVAVAGDDTVAEHKVPQVYGKGCHRDRVRSTQSYTAYRWGHEGVVLAILVRFPFATRPGALPVLVALYRSAAWNQQHGRRHKTPAQLPRQLVAVLMPWFPQRRVLPTGGGNYNSHELASWVHRHRRRLALVSTFYAGANLYAPAPVVTGKKPKGRPRRKGAEQPAPQEVVARQRRRQRLNVAWYGGGRRDIAVVRGQGHWYQSGPGLVPVQWVNVEDRTGAHRPEYVFSTDLALTVAQVVESYTGRWNIATTFEEMRSYLKLEKTRGRSEKTVLRTGPCLFGLYELCDETPIAEAPIVATRSTSAIGVVSFSSFVAKPGCMR